MLRGFHAGNILRHAHSSEGERYADMVISVIIDSCPAGPMKDQTGETAGQRGERGHSGVVADGHLACHGPRAVVIFEALMAHLSSADAGHTCLLGVIMGVDACRRSIHEHIHKHQEHGRPDGPFAFV